MKTDQEYQQELAAAVESGNYLVPIIDLHCFDIEKGDHTIWLKVVDKDQKETYVYMNQDFITSLSKEIMIAKSKFQMNHSIQKET